MSLSERLDKLAERVQNQQPDAADVENMKVLIAELRDTFGYELAMIEEQQIETPHTQCGYVVGQIRNDGTFSKWSKVLGSRIPGQESSGYTVYESPADAAQAIAEVPDSIRAYFAVFPVVATAGADPVSNITPFSFIERRTKP
jgi:hypothetical protein